MARRRSEFEDFANSFQTFYGLTQKVGSGIEQALVSDKDFKGADGGPLTGRALDSAKVKRRAEILSRWGDAKGGLELRLLDAQAETAAVAADNARYRTEQENESRKVNNARNQLGLTFDTDSLPDRLTQVNANARQGRSDADVSEATVRARIALPEATLNSVRTSTDATEQNISQNAALFQPRLAAQEEAVLAAQRGNRVGDEAERQAKTDQSVRGDVFRNLSDALRASDGSAEDRNKITALAIQGIRGSGMSPEAQGQAIAAVNEQGVPALLKQQQAYSLDMLDNVQKGVPNFVEWHSKKDDGLAFKWEPGSDGAGKIIQTDEATGKTSVFMEGRVEDLQARLAAMAKDPMAAAEFMFRVQANELTKANTDLVRAKIAAAGVTAGMSEKDRQLAYARAFEGLVKSSEMIDEKDPAKRKLIIDLFNEAWGPIGGIPKQSGGLGRPGSAGSPGVQLQFGSGWKITPK